MWTIEHTPVAPDYRVDWDNIEKAFPWIRDMRGVQQEPEWHAEGDVFTHTRMVAEAMAAMPQWRYEGGVNQHRLFASALLHDVAKPATTVFDGNRWTSPNHTKVGEPMARAIMWKGQMGGVVPVEHREQIAKLVRYHGLPLRFMDKPDPQRAVIEASQVVNLRLLAQLAAADVKGRECEGQQELLDKIDLFSEYAAEQNCLLAPYQFESQHHRFMFCVGRKAVEYVPYDDTKFEVVVMAGLPGSGKSTWAKQNTEGQWPVICLDDIREELRVDPADREAQPAVVRLGHQRATELLRKQSPFVWDATNTVRDHRAMLIALCAKYGARVKVVYCESPLDDMLRRNRERTGNRRVPEAVIMAMLERLDMPTVNEAHEVVYNVTS